MNMADRFDQQTRSRIMASVKAKDTSPELAVRRALHRAGHRFRLHRGDLPGKPDVVLPRYRIAVFVNGCFWHGHKCGRPKMPKNNAEYWSDKIQRNVNRDAQVASALRAQGWSRKVIWECELFSGIDQLLVDLAEFSC